MKSRRIFLFTFAVFTALLCTSALASNSMHTEPADTMGMGKFALQITGVYAKMNVELTGIDGQVGIGLQPFVGILPMVDVSVNVPLYYTMPQNTDSYFEIGDMDLWTKVMLINPHTHPVGVGVLTIVTVPTGNEEVTPEHPYPTGTGAYAFHIRGLVSKYFLAGLFGLHGNLGYHRENIGGEPLPPTAPEPNYIDWSAAGDFRLWRFVYAYAEVFGSFQKGADAQPVNFGTGLSIGFHPIFAVDVGAIIGAKDTNQDISIISMFTIGF